MNVDKVILIENGSIIRGKVPVLQDINIALSSGEFSYLIGKTGSGKSSLLKSLYGEIPISGTQALVTGIDLKKLTWKTVPQLRRKLGIVFQDFQLLNDRNIYDNLSFVLKSTGWEDKKKINDRIEEVLTEVNLANKGYRMPYELSGGEQQRVDIARAILNNPALILADEPTGNLDPETTHNIMTLLNKISVEHQSAILMATHDYSIIKNYPAKIFMVEEGRISVHEKEIIDTKFSTPIV